jgi:hypothetical protein
MSIVFYILGLYRLTIQGILSKAGLLATLAVPTDISLQE